MKEIIFKKYTFLLSILFVSQFSFAQNNCATAINVPNLDGTGCPSTTHSATNALAPGSCGESGDMDTWFQFTA